MSGRNPGMSGVFEPCLSVGYSRLVCTIRVWFGSTIPVPSRRASSPEELEQLERIAGDTDWKREIAVQLTGRCGLRADEVSYPADQHLR